MENLNTDEIKNITGELKRLLTGAVKKSCTEEKIGIIFSAGIDSTIIAELASQFSEVTAYSVGVCGAHDIEFAEKLKENSNFKIKIIKIAINDVENAAREVVKIIKTPNAVKVSVGVPFYVASKQAAGDGIKVMLCGQGADELFGGYNRYIERIKEDNHYDTLKISEMIREDVENIYENQLNNDSAICASNGIELRFPFMDDEFKNYASAIPVELKIHEISKDEDVEFSCIDRINNKKFIRKFILRKVAEEIKIPGFIISRQKKAAQYGSGANKILDKIARSRGFREKAKEEGRKDYVNLFLEELLKKKEMQDVP
jgi:asparagine synthase (glutamine-hydrolysing)